MDALILRHVAAAAWVDKTPKIAIAAGAMIAFQVMLPTLFLLAA